MQLHGCAKSNEKFTNSALPNFRFHRDSTRGISVYTELEAIPSEITQIGKFNHDRMNERDQNKTGTAPKHQNSALTAGNDAKVERSKGGVRSNRHSSK